MQVNAARMHAIFGGKNPHVQSLRVGGVTCRRDINATRIGEFRELLHRTREFIDTVYVPDAKYLARIYGAWGGFGGFNSFLACGEFPQTADEPGSLFFPRGVIVDRGPVQPLEPADISEHVRHSWYQGRNALHPAAGETLPAYTGLDTADRYSWLKAPRYRGEPMEVGPLARMLVAYGSGMPEAKAAIEGFLQDTDLRDFSAMYSVIGRTAARALETQIIAHAMDGWLDRLSPGTSAFRSTAVPLNGTGMGLNEAPRGALGHWIDIRSQKIGNYQMVVPSTWNFGPRCGAGKPGPVEQALVGIPLADPAKPLEILRAVHSLDPCIACAVHVIDPGNDRAYEIRVL